jgi:hypothetical protein
MANTINPFFYLRAAPSAIVLNTTVHDVFSIFRIGLSGKTYDCLFTGELGQGPHRIDFSRAEVVPGAYALSVKSMAHGQSIKKIIAPE